MSRRTSLGALLLGAALALPGAARSEDGGDYPRPNDPTAPLPVRVNQAIDSGVEWLRKQTMVAGNWPDEVRGNRLYDPNSKGDVYLHPAGPTALALYTLLKCGVDPKSPEIVKGFHWLRTNAGKAKGGVGNADLKSPVHIPRGSYEISTLVLALEAKYNRFKREKDRLRDIQFRAKKGSKLQSGVKIEGTDLLWMKDLVGALVKRRTGGAGWRYNVWTGAGYMQGVRGNNDMSSSQLAMLALLAAERCGIEQSESFYMDMLKWTLEMQEDDGPKVKRWDPSLKSSDDEKYGGVAIMDRARGWAYMKRSNDEGEARATGSMTACGLANLLIGTRILEARESKAYDEALAAKAEQAWHDGVAWLQDWWTLTRNPNNSGVNAYQYYYLYCIERVGDLKGIHLLAGHPWYNEGAQILVDEQLADGSWKKNDTHDPKDVLNTCFALLFLNRSTPAITAD